MIKLLIKKKIIWYLCALLITTIFSLVVIRNIVQGKADSYNIVSQYENSNVDFICPSPSAEQVDELKLLDHIDEVCPYYYSEKTIFISNKSYLGISILLLDNLSDIKKTVYSDKRIIEKVDDVSDCVYIDYKLAKRANLKIGDTLVIQELSKKSYVITRIYETNLDCLKGSIVIQMSDDFKEEYNNDKLTYSGCYIRSNNYSSTLDYLKDYKPMGSLKPKTERETQEAYEQRVNSFMNTNFFNEITDYNSILLKKKSESYEILAMTNRNNIIFPMLIFLISFTLILFCDAIIGKKTINKLILMGAKKNNIICRELIINNCVWLMLLILPFLLFLFSINNLADYCSKNETLVLYLYWLIVGLVFALLNNVFICVARSKGKKNDNSIKK